jgi:hypothetical protein
LHGANNAGQARAGRIRVADVKTKHGIFAMVAIAAIGIMFLAGCETPLPANAEGQKYIMRGDLKLVAQYKPLHLYIYTETSSTNNHPDYVIFQGNEPLIFTDSKSNTVQITLCEKDFRGQLSTTYDYKGQILKRSFATSNDDSMQTNYLYFDSNGDGQWDFLHISGTNAESSKSFVRSNLCWVPK